MRRAVTLQCLLNRVEEILISERLGQKFHGARFHGPDGHRNVSVRGDEYDGDFDAFLDESPLEIETAHLRQSYIEDQTARAGVVFLAKKLLGACKGFGAQSNGLDEILYRLTHAASSSTTKTVGNASEVMRVPRL